jgi:hypothetical protein
MPVTTGVSAVPSTRPAGEVSGALAPIFRLSDAARGEDRNGKANPQLSALFDPAKLLGLPGLLVGARVWGTEDDTGIEPMLGYRHAIDDRISIAGVGYGTHMRADDNGAHYEASRAGGEAIADVRLADVASWLSAHAQGAAQVTYIKASGRYCYDGTSGDGKDCAEDGSVPFSYAKLSGVFPAATLSLALDAHVKDSWFHHARLAGMISTGWMPRLVAGDQRAGDPYVTGGVSLTIAFGAADE